MNNLRRNIRKNEQVVISELSAHYPFISLYDRVFVVVSGPGMSHLAAGSRIMGKFLSNQEEAEIRGWDISVEETDAWQHTKHRTYVATCSLCRKGEGMIKSVKPIYLVDVEVNLPGGMAQMEPDTDKAIRQAIEARLHVHNGVREEDIESMSVSIASPRHGHDSLWVLRYRVELRDNSMSSDIKAGNNA